MYYYVLFKNHKNYPKYKTTWKKFKWAIKEMIIFVVTLCAIGVITFLIALITVIPFLIALGIGRFFNLIT